MTAFAYQNTNEYNELTDIEKNIVNQFYIEADGDIAAAIAALEDGDALEFLGYGDDDQEEIEAAHAFLTSINK
jgi:hypothetical protein